MIICGIGFGSGYSGAVITGIDGATSSLSSNDDVDELSITPAVANVSTDNATNNT